jgi:hypothetical protein
MHCQARLENGQLCSNPAIPKRIDRCWIDDHERGGRLDQLHGAVARAVTALPAGSSLCDEAPLLDAEPAADSRSRRHELPEGGIVRLGR